MNLVAITRTLATVVASAFLMLGSEALAAAKQVADMQAFPLKSSKKNLIELQARPGQTVTFQTILRLKKYMSSEFVGPISGAKETFKWANSTKPTWPCVQIPSTTDRYGIGTFRLTVPQDTKPVGGNMSYQFVVKYTSPTYGSADVSVHVKVSK